MLIGEYSHSLDSKGRMSFPAKFREELGEHFVVTKGPDNCLCCYDLETWEKKVRQYEALPLKARHAQRIFFGGASEAETDASGRILLTPKQREYAGLSKDVTIIGVSTHVEIWDTERYEELCASVSQEDMLNTLEELGF